MYRPQPVNLTHDDYNGAIVCLLEVEMSAMRYMLDEEHAWLPACEGDLNRYICGRLGYHNVAIGHLPQGSQGLGAAAIAATNVKRTFSKAKLCLLVGIGGIVPSRDDDVRLGDVIIGMPTGAHDGVVQYDVEKDSITGFERKEYAEPPPTYWRSCVAEMESDHRVKENRIPMFLNEMISKHPGLATYKRPPQETDILFEPTYKHIASELTCQKCDQDQLISRSPRMSDRPVIFYGLTASVNQVEKNTEKSDKVAVDAGGVISFETETAGLMDNFQCVIIHGISDYADSHKNDSWHTYAAAVAAGCAKELLTYVDPLVGKSIMSVLIGAPLCFRTVKVPETCTMSELNLNQPRTTGDNVKLTKTDILLLETGGINDKLISFWEQHLERKYVAPSKRISILFLRPEISRMLSGTSDCRIYQEHFTNINATHCFFPISRHMCNATGRHYIHWSLLLIDRISNVAAHFDSATFRNRTEAQHMAKMLSEASLWLPTESPDVHEPEIRELVIETPEQEHQSSNISPPKRRGLCFLRDKRQKSTGSGDGNRLEVDESGFLLCSSMKHILVHKLLTATTKEKVKMQVEPGAVSAEKGRQDIMNAYQNLKQLI